MKIKFDSTTRFERVWVLLSQIFSIGYMPKEETDGTAIIYINFFGREWLWSVE